MFHLRPWCGVVVILLSSPSHAYEASALRSSRTLSDEDMLKSKHRSFADDLTALIHTNDNDCTSAWGVSMMLALLHPAAENETASEMCDILGFSCAGDGDSVETPLAWSSTGSELDDRYTGQCLAPANSQSTCYSRAPTLDVANSVWIDEGTDVKSSYNNTVGSFLMKTDFSKGDAGSIVNEWVKESTNGLIDSIIDDGEIEYDLIAINSIYLNATWKAQFPMFMTNTDSFYPTASTATTAHFMHAVEHFDYSHTALPGFQVLKMKYLSSALSMIVVLPAAASNGNAINAVKSADVVDALLELESTKMAVAFPKFKFATTYADGLVQALKDVGLTQPFEGGQGFCGMFEGSCPFLSLVKQKTYINVHEKGTEAAAVTAGAVATSMPLPEQPTLFMADRPFKFYIYDQDEDLVLFEGHVGDPEIPEGSSAALNSQHADEGEDFWQKNFNEVPIQPNMVVPTTTPPQQTSSTVTAIQPTTNVTSTATSTTQPPPTTVTATQSTTDIGSSATSTTQPSTAASATESSTETSDSATSTTTLPPTTVTASTAQSTTTATSSSASAVEATTTTTTTAGIETANQQSTATPDSFGLLDDSSSTFLVPDMCGKLLATLSVLALLWIPMW